MSEAPDPDQHTANIRWVYAWTILIKVNRTLLIIYGSVALASLAGMGGAGDAPGLLGFYMDLLNDCLVYLFCGVLTFGAALFLRSLAVETPRPDPRKWFYKYAFDRPWLEKIFSVLPDFLNALLLIMVAMQVAIVCLPIIYLLGNRTAISSDVTCESQYRISVIHPNYQIEGKTCEDYKRTRDRR